MNADSPNQGQDRAKASAMKSVKLAPTGPLDWRSLVLWLHSDAVISTEEAQRINARCAQAESAQHPLVRLASVSVRRAGDGKPLDIVTDRQAR